MARILSGVPWTAGVDDNTTELEARNDAADDAVIVDVPSEAGYPPLRDTAANLAAVVPAAGQLAIQTDAPYAVAFGDGSTAYAALRKFYTGPGPGPVVVVKADANISMAGTTGTWVDSDPSGTAAARTYDIVIPNVSVGDRVGVSMVGQVNSAAGSLSVDFATYVAGVKVHQLGTSGFGSMAWSVPASVQVNWQGGIGGTLVLDAGDIENGAVRLRMQHLGATGTTRTLVTASTVKWVQFGWGPWR